MIFLRFFNGKKRIGYKDLIFLSQINEVLICLICTAIFHCLRQWRTDALDDIVEFKHDTHLGRPRQLIVVLFTNIDCSCLSAPA